MNDDSSLLEQLFSRIEILEKEQKELNQKIKQVDTEIKDKKNTMVLQKWKSLDKIKEDKSQNELTKNHIIQTLNNLLTQINSDAIPYTFTFTPPDKKTCPVFISGDFTNWSNRKMTKENDTYSFETILLKGYIYSYCFYADEKKLIDFNSLHQSIPKMKSDFNIVKIPNDKGTAIEIWNANSNSLPSSFENVNSTIKSYEGRFIKELINLSNTITQRKEDLIKLRREKISEIIHFYKERIELFSNKCNNFIKEFKERFIERIIKRDNLYYQIKDFDIRNKVLKCFPLYDPNGIKVDFRIHRKIPFFILISLSSLFDTAVIIPKIQSDKILENFKNDHKNILKINYKLQFITSNSNEMEIVPYKIEPENIDINQYHFTIEKNFIKEIQHKSSQSFVLFHDLQIGEVQMAQNISGFVSSSQIKVYTTLYDKDILNIFHIHLNDTSQEITVDSVFLENNENIFEHKTFSLDSIGRKLNYKFIFKEYKLAKVYYNMSNEFIDEPSFEEIRVKPNNIMRLMRGVYKNYYGVVKEFPIGMLARKDKEKKDLKNMKSIDYEKDGTCGDRHLEELPGFLTIEVTFAPEMCPLDKPIMLSIPVCHMNPLSPDEEIEFEKKMILKQNQGEQEKIDFVDNMWNKCKKYEEYIKDDSGLDKLSLDSLKEILSEMEKKINWEEYNVEGENLEDKIVLIEEVQSRIKSILYQKIRIKVLSGGK